LTAVANCFAAQTGGSRVCIVEESNISAWAARSVVTLGSSEPINFASGSLRDPWRQRFFLPTLVLPDMNNHDGFPETTEGKDARLVLNTNAARCRKP
jgi:hypothetical protein